MNMHFVLSSVSKTSSNCSACHTEGNLTNAKQIQHLLKSSSYLQLEGRCTRSAAEIKSILGHREVYLWFLQCNPENSTWSRSGPLCQNDLEFSSPIENLSKISANIFSTGAPSQTKVHSLCECALCNAPSLIIAIFIRWTWRWWGMKARLNLLWKTST